MRTTIFAFLSILAVAGCGDTTMMNPTPVRDMAMKANPDLTQPLNGCNGLLNCYVDCNSSNPTQACFDDCDAGATQMALDLINAFGDCINTQCFMTNNADSGKPYCDTNSNDPTADPACNDCYNRILGNGGACRAAQNACTANKP